MTVCVLLLFKFKLNLKEQQSIVSIQELALKAKNGIYITFEKNY